MMFGMIVGLDRFKPPPSGALVTPIIPEFPRENHDRKKQANKNTYMQKHKKDCTITDS